MVLLKIHYVCIITHVCVIINLVDIGFKAGNRFAVKFSELHLCKAQLLVKISTTISTP